MRRRPRRRRRGAWSTTRARSGAGRRSTCKPPSCSWRAGSAGLETYDELGIARGGSVINVRALLAEAMAAEDAFEEAGAILTELDLAIEDLAERERAKHRRFVLERWN